MLRRLLTPTKGDVAAWLAVAAAAATAWHKPELAAFLGSDQAASVVTFILTTVGTLVAGATPTQPVLR